MIWPYCISELHNVNVYKRYLLIKSGLGACTKWEFSAIKCEQRKYEPLVLADVCVCMPSCAIGRCISCFFPLFISELIVDFSERWAGRAFQIEMSDFFPLSRMQARRPCTASRQGRQASCVCRCDRSTSMQIFKGGKTGTCVNNSPIQMYMYCSPKAAALVVCIETYLHA